MKIRLINPNTTQRMTDAMGRCAREVAAAGTEIVAVVSADGAAVDRRVLRRGTGDAGLLAEIVQGERDGCDAYVIACFGDPGLYAARERARGPVIGIAEAAMHAASVLAPGFGRHDARAHLRDGVASRRALRDETVLPQRARDRRRGARARPAGRPRRIIVDECRRALDEDGADAIVLGCAGMAEFAHEIEQQIGAPVVEGVTAAVNGPRRSSRCASRPRSAATTRARCRSATTARSPASSPPDGDQAEPVANLPQPHIHTV